MATTRNEVVKLARSWIGLNETDGSYKKIIDIYNSQKEKDLPRGLKMKYDWSWCASTVSALAIQLKATDIMPIEISCGNLIEQAKKMGIWVEKDDYVPKPGDEVLYDWDDTGKGDNTGWADHVGVVEEVYKSNGYFTVIEGNYKNAVKRRTVMINGRYIRGFITPKYKEIKDNGPSDSAKNPDESGKNVYIIAQEVICGKWGIGSARRSSLKSAGYDPDEVQRTVNYILNGKCTTTVTTTDIEQPAEKHVIASGVARYHSQLYNKRYKTTANLYCRDGAGTNKKALCKIPKGTTVACFGYYERVKDDIWPYVMVVMDGIEYHGFCHSAYLRA